MFSYIPTKLPTQSKMYALTNTKLLHRLATISKRTKQASVRPWN